MNIQEAVKQAVQCNGVIVRFDLNPDFNPENFTVIRPTSSYECCIVEKYHNGKKSGRCGYWNPTADDLTADDWTVIHNPDE